MRLSQSKRFSMMDFLRILIEHTESFSAQAKFTSLTGVVAHVGLQKHLGRFVEIKNRDIRAPFPTWTILEIAGLARPGLVIKIKAVAYSPGK